MKKLAVIVIAAYILFSCGTSSNNGPGSAVKVNYNEYCQVIDGFGGSDAWAMPPSNYEASMELVKLLYSKTEGAGFTILRNRIPFRERLEGDDSPDINDGFMVRNSDNSYQYTDNADGTKTFELNWGSWDLSGTKTLIGYIKSLGEDGPEQLTIMSTPWTPPNNRVTQWKEDVIGVSTELNAKIDWSKPDHWGRLKRDKYNDYADLLADYVKNFETQMGAPLAILSVQNEPNMKVQYESAYWSGTDIRDFVKVIGQRFPMKGITPGVGGIGIMIPEFENFDVNFYELIKPSLDDPESAKVLTHIALHQYNAPWDPSERAGSKAFPEIIESGKRFWQTEVSGLSGPNMPVGNGINNALFYARMVHFDLTLAQTNAYLYWWLWINSTKEDDFPGALGVMVDGDRLVTALRLYAIGQYSRFIRPGWYRIDSDTSPASNVYSSAYRNPQSKEIAIVIINNKLTRSAVSIDLSGAKFDELAIWRTSEKEELKSIGRQETSINTANVSLPPKSITTLYGTVK